MHLSVSYYVTIWKGIRDIGKDYELWHWKSKYGVDHEFGNTGKIGCFGLSWKFFTPRYRLQSL